MAPSPGDERGVLGRYAPAGHADEPSVEVRLLNFPLPLFLHSRERHDELQREFTLMAIRPPEQRPGHEVPARLLELIDVLGRQYGGAADRSDADRDAAIERGEVSVDLTYELPPSAGPALRQLDQLMEDADAFCRSEDLLTLAATPTETRFRRWYLEQFMVQLAGGDPTPWDGPTHPDQE
jgi:hypothetical protein